MKIPSVLSSKKFWAAVVAAVVAAVLQHYGWPVEKIALCVTGPLIAYVLGQGLADLGKERKE